jgi:hypothetical protein
MRTLLGWILAWLFGAVGWWLGGHLGLGSAVLLSALAGGAGLYLGHRWFDQNLK